MTSDPHPQTWRGAHARRWAALVLVGLVSLELLALTGIAPPPHDTLRPAALGPFLAGGFFVAFLIFLGTRPRLPETGAVLGAAALLLFMGWPTGSGSALKIAVIAGASLGEAALLALAVRMGRPRGEARRDAVNLFAAASLLPGFIMASGSGMALTTALHPFTYDGAAYLVDAGLGFQPSFAVGRSFLASPAFGLVCALAYGCLPLSIGALLLIPARPDRPAPRADLLESFLLAGVLGCTLYHFCPSQVPTTPSVRSSRALSPTSCRAARSASPRRRAMESRRFTPDGRSSFSGRRAPAVARFISRLASRWRSSCWGRWGWASITSATSSLRSHSSWRSMP